jgi:hypothetical protein
MTGLRMVVTGSDSDAFGAEATHPDNASAVNFTDTEISDARSLGRYGHSIRMFSPLGLELIPCALGG